MAPFRGLSVVGALCVLVLLTVGRSAEGAELPALAPLPEAHTGVVVNIPARTLYWFEGGTLVRTFSVGVGKVSSPTPVGEYRVESKAVHPWWLPPGGGAVVSPGPANPLGTRWIGFQGGYGIHGNNNPSSIGHLVSLGCVRMYQKDVEWLYDRVAIGTPVTVLYRPVEIQQTSSGRRYLVSYPDVYDRGTPGLDTLLRSAGLRADVLAPGSPGPHPLDAKVYVNGLDWEAVLHGGRPALRVDALDGILPVRVEEEDGLPVIQIGGQVVPHVQRDSGLYLDAATAAALLGLEFEANLQTGVAWLSGTPLFGSGR
jgi:hypothetical protein